MLQYSIFIYIPSDLVLLAQAHQLPNAGLFLPNKILPGLLYSFHDRCLYPIHRLNEYRILPQWKMLLHTHCIYTLHHSTNTHLLSNDQPLLLPEHLQPKPFLSALVLLWAQQSALM